MNLNKIYGTLLDEYGYQGWWPLINNSSSNFNKTGEVKGYHPKEYDYPKNEEEKIEIILGCILMQNTSWLGAYKAIGNINENIGFNISNLVDFVNTKPNEFKQIIKPAGYYNQKCNYILNVLNFYTGLSGDTPSRKEILEVKGVGNETADTILLFAYKQKEFIVDTYLKRIFINLGYINKNTGYMHIKNLCENNFNGNFEDYQEFHALLDEHAKNYYIKKPYGVEDKLLEGYKL